MTKQDIGFSLFGLTTEEAKTLRARFGRNELTPETKRSIFREILKALSEPMFLLLLSAAVIYFILGEPRDGAVMLVFVFGVISIDVIQEWKTDKTLDALKDLSAPHVKVIRDGEEKMIASAELVPGDLMLISEGIKIPADGDVIRANDLCVDESSLTGEADGVWKAAAGCSGQDKGDIWKKDYVYAGTLVTQGSAMIRVEKTGASTEYGKIGADVASAPENPTPLQKQTGKLVKLCAGIASVLLALVGFVTWLNLPDHAFGDRLIESVLSGITLSMAMIPEEFPVILTVFLSLGAWRLAKKQSLVRKLPAVETLGAVSVLCVDKTGTITQNRMTVCETWAIDGDQTRLCEIMGMGCETDTYDPMEKAMLSHCERLGISRDRLFSGKLITEYSFTSQAKIMGHVWRRGNEVMIAAKGSPERILDLCCLNEEERKQTEEKITELSEQALRVIAVGFLALSPDDELPEELEACSLMFCGLIGLADPPRESVKQDIRRCIRAGVRVVMITGDSGITASSIACRIGMPDCEKVLSGDELNEMTDEELCERVKEVNIFSRVVPEHKMRIVKALKENGEVVAMTGDGVNDASALKYADIGIAMGMRGSEVSREAADLILLDDNFSTIVETIRDGRRIYDNIKKSIGYVFSIHVPIALSSLLAPMLSISPDSLMLLPLHVVLLELVIDPTCSVVLERQPAEQNVMERSPRDPNETIVGVKSLIRSLVQGFMIFAASFGTYLTVLQSGSGNAAAARAMGLSVIFLSNLLLVLVNCSDVDSAYNSLKRLLKDRVMWAVAIGTLSGLALALYTPIAGFLKLAPLSWQQLFIVTGASAAAVLWVELLKLARRVKKG